MFASDETHLTDFGICKVWPLYLMLGNLSKYFRAQPNSGAMHHLAYIPSLPSSFREFVESFHPKWKTQGKQILTHCRCDLMHAVWEKILDDDFLHAYTYGIVVMCIDGVERRIYPRLFTYSADYPEKVLLATIRDKGACPCPRCLVPKAKLDRLGLQLDIRIRINQLRTYISNKVDSARRAIYEFARPITGAQVENLLKPFSGVPTQNAFVKRLGDEFNPSNMLVVDLLHEFELGVWKSLFTHLIRLLYAAADGSDELVIELDRRYRLISTFGHGTIRKFATNPSEMKKLAARDFEDLLQCAIPAFEGLLPKPHNNRLMKLLYRTAEWHALAKLRMHTDSTLNLLESLTTEFGKLMREFRDLTGSAFSTMELPRETAARARARESRTAPGKSSSMPSAASTGAKRARLLNLLTVKFHFLGDYVRHIRLFGTTDSYSTQLGELAHRLVKSFYGLTNKKDATKQIGRKVIRKEVLSTDEQQEIVDAARKSRVEDHHVISDTKNKPVQLFEFVAGSGDPVKKNFIPKLQDHLLGRILDRQFDGDDHDFSNEQRNCVRIQNNIIYQHGTIRINYTTYDMRRDYDTVNPRTHPFVMLRSPETAPGTHPFWYAAVLGVYHTFVQHVGPDSRSFQPKKMEFLLVRWLGGIPNRAFGRKQARLPQVGFVPDSDDYAFSFLDPALIIRGCHLIPAFADGKTKDLLSTGPSIARPDSAEEDWRAYYVGIFVDRDMFMRFLGLGLRHLCRPETDEHDSTAAMDDEPPDDDETDDGSQDHSVFPATNQPEGDLDEPSDNEEQGNEEEGNEEQSEQNSGESEIETDLGSSDSEASEEDDFGYDDL